MKNILKNIITRILQWEAKLILDKYHPKIIGVTGSVGKTSTKDAIYRVLSKGGFSVRKSEKSYNSETGLPLTILGCQSAWNDPFGWLEIILYGLRQLFSNKPYPKWLVLEVGLEYPGDIKNILKWVKFDVAVTTLIPEVPVHMELFASKEDVINEKMLLPKSVTSEGIVLLNADDLNALKFVPEIKADIFTYGQNDKADYRAGMGETYYENKDGYDLPTGLEFTLYHSEKDLTVRIPGVVGNHQIYPVLSALALGEKLGLNMVEMADSFSDYLPPAGRLCLLAGIKDTIILDDTYNASPVAMSAGLTALESFHTKGRKIAVMGDMLQLGGMTVEAHKKIGYQAAEFCDLVITVGLRSRFIDDALVEKKFHRKRIKHFDDSVEAGKFLQSKLQPGDVIFVKGSQLTRMEKVVEEVMLHPELKDKLLVRQDKEWAKR
ncbi:MAG TPA: UDP-N-acetylmuramoyl-tripeptide--D-alanyl-D-alanine ligase [Candidatus Paceibacterota bacterium]|nr:UDP-N-acetylmuramoyl-tripeptide--D-alanyl-D-alanine ligase [Candidatus Paceibacterota bacterium]